MRLAAPGRRCINWRTVSAQPRGSNHESRPGRNTKKLEHNVILKGKTTEHQIDVYWEFEAGGTTYYTIVQAKDWGQPVNQGHMLTLKGVLDDLNIRATGIMVTRTGYQDGAEKVAKGYGIVLYELREMTDSDWAGRIKTIIVRINILDPKISDVKFMTDDAWLAQKKRELDVPAGDPIEIFGMAGALQLTAEDGKPAGLMSDILNKYIPTDLQPHLTKDISHDFEPGLFIATKHAKIPRMPIRGLRCKFEVGVLTEERRLGGENFAHFILKNTLENKAHLFSKEQKLFKKVQ